jgi:hypothetical protein
MAGFFQTSCETRELHSDVQLRTRYYRNSFAQTKDAIEKAGKEMGFEIRGFNQAHGEIDIIGNGFEAIITALQITPIETGVDIKMNLFSFIGMGKPKKLTLQIYALLDKSLKFKGVSLHP